MKEQLLGVLEEIRPDLDWEAEKQLIDGGVLDSFDIVSIVGALNDEFDIDIHVGNLVPENFNSIEGMMKLIEKLQQEDLYEQDYS